MGPQERLDDALASTAKTKGRAPSTICPSRTLSAACSRYQYADLSADNRSSDLPFAAPSDGWQYPQTFNRLLSKSLLRKQDGKFRFGRTLRRQIQKPSSVKLKKLDADKVRRILVCTGKVYYDLVKYRKEHEIDDVVIVRLEQLYPFPHKSFREETSGYSFASEVVWVQDEPQNQGAWFYVQHHLLEEMPSGARLSYAGRPASSSPAVGYASKHAEQLKELGKNAFDALKALFRRNSSSVAL